MKKKGKLSEAKGKGIRKKSPGVFFLGAVFILYLFLFLLEPEGTSQAIKISASMFMHILPALALIILVMGLVNYFVEPGTVSKYVGKGSGIKGWILAICTGVLSHGPIYAWYPLLRKLRDQGMKNSLIAAFLYNRSIKIPLLPVIVYYFGSAFVVVLTFYLVIASIVQGYVVQIMNREE